jgi:hypothetical protein
VTAGRAWHCGTGSASLSDSLVPSAAHCSTACGALRESAKAPAKRRPQHGHGAAAAAGGIIGGINLNLKLPLQVDAADDATAAAAP